MTNLVHRILTGIVGAMILLGVIYVGDIPFLIFVVTISSIGIWEFYNLMKKIDIKCYKVIGIIINLCICILFFLAKGHMFLMEYDILLPALLSCLIILAFTLGVIKTNFKNAVFTIIGIFYVSWLINHLLLLRAIPIFGRNLVFLLFFSIWSLDTFAYFFGIKFGKRQLSKISPKKSIEGSIAGSLACILTVLVLKYILNTNLTLINSLILGALIAIFGQIGDLAESLIKRTVGVKDSGAILPGHGGILDRFDSIIFAVPITYYYVMILRLI